MTLQFTEWQEGIYINDVDDTALTGYYRAMLTDNEEKENFVYLEPHYIDKRYVWVVLWKDFQFGKLYAKLHKVQYENEELELAKQNVDNFLTRVGDLAVFL